MTEGPNAGIVRRIAAHLNEHGRPGPEELHAPDVEFFTRREAAGTPTRYQGFDGLTRANEEIREVWDEDVGLLVPRGLIRRIQQYGEREPAFEAAGISR